MTSFPASSVTDPSVPVATGSGGDAQTVAAFQAMLAALTAHLQAGAAAPAVPAVAVAAPAVAVTAPAVTPATAPVATSPPAVSSSVQVPGPAAGMAFHTFHTHAPWLAGSLYVVVPAAPLMAIVNDDEGLWYSITKGKYVGVTLSNALALNAVVGVSSSAMKSYKTQDLAVAAFNEMLRFGFVTVLA